MPNQEVDSNRCQHRPSSHWERFKGMLQVRGVFSPRYKCPTCGAIYQIPTVIALINKLFVISLMILAFFGMIPFLLMVVIIFCSHPIYILYSPLQYLKD